MFQYKNIYCIYDNCYHLDVMGIDSHLQQDREKDWPCALKASGKQNFETKYRYQVKRKVP